jgi:hypothetical protein
MSEIIGFGISFVKASGDQIAYSGGCASIDAAITEARTGLTNIHPRAAYADIYRGSLRPEGEPVERVTR